MNKTLHNFRIDIILFLLLGADIALVTFTRREPAGGHPGFGWHLHVIVSTLLALGCLIHIALHWQWFQAVLTGKVKGKTKLIMNSMVVIAMLLAVLSGHEVLASNTARRLHSLTGYFALLGLFVHVVKHTRWMAAMTKKLITAGRQENIIRSA